MTSTRGSRYGIESGFGTTKAPWDGIGVNVEGALSAEDAIVTAGLDWKVAKKNMKLICNEAEVKGFQAVVRTDTQEVLGVHTPAYQVLQNDVAFQTFNQPLLDAGFEFHAAGSIKGGKRVFVFGIMPGSMWIGNDGKDEVYKGLLLTNSHDGSAAVRIRPMPLRKVCLNTMNGMFRSGGYAFKHTGDIGRKVSDMQRFLMKSEQEYLAVETSLNQLAQTPMRAGTMETDKFLFELFGQELDAEISTRISNQMDTVVDLFKQGIGNQGISRWDMYNGVTQYVDHVRGNDKGDGRLNSAWFGAGSDMKAKAWELLTAVN